MSNRWASTDIGECEWRELVRIEVGDEEATEYSIEDIVEYATFAVKSTIEEGEDVYDYYSEVMLQWEKERRV